MTLKSLLFGSAALLAAGTGAQAADLPTAEPVEYVRICDAFGTGFFYIPGTDTCLRISGRVRIEAHYVDEFDGDDDDDDDDFGDDFFGVDRETNNFTTRARGILRADARTQTDFGMVRAYIALQGTVGPGSSASVITFPDENINNGEGERSGDPNYDDSTFELDQAFIQISNDAGSFLAGHSDSFFDFFGSNTFGTRVGIDDSTTSQTLFGYTFSTDAFSAAIALEDPASSGRRRDPRQGNESYEGQELPDLVANLRGEFGFGSAQLMGALRHIHDKEDLEQFEGEDDDDMLGFAVGAGVATEFGGFGFNAQVGYTEGMLGYITNDPGGTGDFSTDFDLIDLDGDGDVDVVDTGDSDTNSAFGIRAGLSAGFTDSITANLDASYTRVMGGDDDDDGDGDGDGDGDSDLFNPDYDFIGVAANVVYSPVEGLIMGPEVAYNHINFDNDDDDGADDDDDGGEDDIFGVMFRIQRDF
jgi:opacity protein-like surface antigen